MEKNTRNTGKTANELTPFIPTHPGAILKDEIECRGISVPRLAEDMGVECSDLEDVLNEKRPLTGGSPRHKCRTAHEDADQL